MRYPLQPIAEDGTGIKVPNVVFTAYPYADTMAAAAITQDAAGVWSVTEASLPAASTLFASSDSAVNTALAGPMTSLADGSTVVGYLDAGVYTVIGKVGTRFFVIPVFYAGQVHDMAVGSTITAGMTDEMATAAIVAAIEANALAISSATDSNVTALVIAGDAPVAGTIPAEVAALALTDSEEDDVAHVVFDNFEIYFTHDGTDWVETVRNPRNTGAADPTTMTFTV